MSAGHGKVKFLRRSDLARLTGCHPETIRYYEKTGLLPEPPRTAANYRVYDQGHADRLSFVMRARALGFTLEEIRSLLGLVDREGGSCAKARSVASAHLASVRDRIAELRRIEAVLAETVARCAGGDVPECAVIEALLHGA